MNNQKYNYNPDILETIANLSNDEVFTPPKVAREMLDMLPKEVWSNSKLKFLDPAVKTGIFLREITSRLIEGLADEIPDLQERVNHILTKQVYGVGITQLTTLMSRRTLYCSKDANGPYSICTEFANAEGNILFPDTKHDFNEKNGRCEDCGANRDSYENVADRENYAYSFIHKNFEEVFGNMKFDVIIGNPPYQLDVGNEGGNNSRASALYHLFINKSLELNPKYITMIVPSRWMTKSTIGIPEEWTDKMIADKRMKEIHDFQNADHLFRNVGLMGGACYFLWDKNYNGNCNFYSHKEEKVEKYTGPLNIFNSGIIIREIKAISIIEKIIEEEGDYIERNSKNFSSLVSAKSYFGNNDYLVSSWKGYSKEKTEDKNIMYYISNSFNDVDIGWVSKKDIAKGFNTIRLHKVYISAAHGGVSQVLGVPRYGKPNSVCSQTYVVIGYDDKKHNLTENQCENIISYIKTKFFRFMVSIKKKTQNGARGVYQFVPLQDFSKPWTDEELYKKYKLTQEEIDYIEENIAPME